LAFQEQSADIGGTNGEVRDEFDAHPTLVRVTGIAELIGETSHAVDGIRLNHSPLPPIATKWLPPINSM